MAGAFLVTALCSARAQNRTRGVGIYPGDPKEDYSPRLVVDSAHYRNLALHRAAYQSSSYDYNLTAQLITDGIIDTALPGWIVTTSSTEGILPRNEREWILDRHPMTRVTLEGAAGSLQVEMAGNSTIPALDSLSMSGTVLTDSLPPRHWDISLSGSADGTRWRVLGQASGESLPGDTLTGFFRRFSPPNLRIISCPFKLDTVVAFRFYRLSVNSPNARRWMISELGMYSRGRRAEVGGPYHFTSAWKSAGSGVEWVSVDLGARCTVERILLHWIRRASEGSVQTSTDGKRWLDVGSLVNGAESVETIQLGRKMRARFVRIVMRKPVSREGYILSELEVYGTGGLVPVAHGSSRSWANGHLSLAGGAWRLQRASLVSSEGETISTSGFDPAGWVPATVPATVLVSYLNDGALPDPNFSDNQLAISESFFYSDFWYRDEFTVPRVPEGKNIRLHFDGINWKAVVYLNGHRVGSIDGAFCRGAFDVSARIKPGKNVLAVRILKNATPGFATEQTRYSPDANGGELGADNPTFHASVGWDWIPTIRGRNTGIWNTVYLSEGGQVTIEDPLVSTTIPLPDTSVAEIELRVTLRNSSSTAVEGSFRGTFGDKPFEERVRLSPLESRTLLLDPSTHPSLRVSHPRLWWPNGYGNQNLYEVHLAFLEGRSQASDHCTFETGIRQMTYAEGSGALKIWVNGRRFIARGGNWGFPESMLRYRAREYDIAVRYHREMNFTMIRNWVGQTADDAFFDACDRHGIMVWQDFWLANPLDGPEPNDDAMFMRNGADFVKRIRNHPSIALYVGRNEGNPPAPIDSALRRLLSVEHPGLHYISNSAFGVVSGGGPYRRMSTKFYFERRATEKLHSEMGMPAVVSFESLREMLPDSLLWPQNTLWGMHDFTLEGAQYGNSFNSALEDHFGKVDDLRLWLACAQQVNYEGYRSMFEAQSRNRMGLLLWMSHPAWPSLVWQTYDYYFEPTAAYFGSRKACEPLHIQWNASSDSIEVVNYSVPGRPVLTAKMEIVGLDGTVHSRASAPVECPEDSLCRCFALGAPEDSSAITLVRLRLERNGVVVSDNSYWRGLRESARSARRRFELLQLASNTEASLEGGIWRLRTTIANSSKAFILSARIRAVGSKSGKRILPAYYGDNYFPLVPGQTRIVRTEMSVHDAGGERPTIESEGLAIE
ncbi:MAG TPA: discoidin domain-containing protein [Bacteroidota bacterium]|nr:discoidin domain-containing protein [Bacteroidota bacterium]